MLARHVPDSRSLCLTRYPELIFTAHFCVVLIHLPFYSMYIDRSRYIDTSIMNYENNIFIFLNDDKINMKI